MEVLAPSETRHRSWVTHDFTAPSSFLKDFSPTISVAFFHNSTVFPKPTRIEGLAKEMITRLIRMRDLKDNWNGYGAERPSALAIKNAIKFIIDNLQFELPYYFAAPGVNGEVMIELKVDDNVAEIYFWEDNSTELLLLEKEQVVLESTLITDYEKLLKFF